MWFAEIFVCMPHTMTHLRHWSRTLKSVLCKKVSEYAFNSSVNNVKIMAAIY